MTYSIVNQKKREQLEQETYTMGNTLFLTYFNRFTSIQYP